MVDATAKNLAVGVERCLTREGLLYERLEEVQDSASNARAEERERYDQTLRLRTDERNAALDKVKSLRPFATIGKGTIVIGAAAGGFILYNALRP